VTAPRAPVFRDGLRIAKLRGMHEELQAYRDYEPVGPEAKRGSGQVLPFVRGLYLSAQVIYFIREVVRGQGLDVNWGHIIHDSQVYCSPECDIVIHNRGSVSRWNGDVMDFHFIDLSKVIAVVSCKSRVLSVDGMYGAQLRGFGIKTVALFGEVCSASNYANLKAQAQQASYCNFWCLALEEEGHPKYDENVLLEFIRFLEGLRVS
jgi:hypothetical protein